MSKKLILDKLTSIKTDKSPGPDTILPRVLYECRFELVNPLYVLFRACCEQSKFPSEWKKANVIPIYKKGKKNNYRPISLTSTVCKLYESIIRDQILYFFTVNDKISSSQFGFLSGKSCALQLLYVVNEWIKILDVNIGVGIFYSDFRKAFDSVSHIKLLFKLENMGITGPLLALLKDYLSDRTQRVVLDDHYSQYVDVTNGVPQGSVLGPILFLAFIDDEPDLRTRSQQDCSIC